jgi:hypothetical protein
MQFVTPLSAKQNRPKLPDVLFFYVSTVQCMKSNQFWASQQRKGTIHNDKKASRARWHLLAFCRCCGEETSI